MKSTGKNTGKPAWQTPVIWFTLFNLIAAPFIGRAIWFFMQQLNTGNMRIGAVALSLAGAVGILATNSALSVWAARSGLPKGGQRAMWLITGGTFVLTIGFGTFSPINLVIAMLRAAAG
jgi:hypothetical protein